jgi:hypothetical protein
MKYFTPERYLRLANLTDEQAFLAAQRDWEQAVDGYKDQLRRIRKKLPTGLARLVDSVYLHDARVLDMWQGRPQSFHHNAAAATRQLLPRLLPPQIAEVFVVASRRRRYTVALYDQAIGIGGSAFAHEERILETR